MFKSKKEKKEKNTSLGSTSSYNETTKVESNNGRIVTTRQVSSQSSQFRSTQERSFTVQHSSSTGNVPSSLLSGSSLRGIQTDAVPFSLGGSSRIPTVTTSMVRLPTTSLSSSFAASSSSAQPRSSLPVSPRSTTTVSTTRATPYRSVFSGTTFGSYPSRSSSSPYVASSGQNNNNNNNNVQAARPRALSTPNQDIIPTYPNDCSKRGKVLIINNIKFIEKNEERLGAEKDSQDLTKLLKKIGFEVDTVKNLKGKEMLKKIENFSKSRFTNYDMSIVVIMSHGTNVVIQGNKKVAIKGGYTEIVGTDNEPVLVDDIIEKFTVSYCHPSLRFKPKIFIFQCCRGERDQEVCHDAAPIKRVLKEHSDILIAFSTLPGYLSNRNPKTGSWYIQKLCEVLGLHYKDFHIEEMLKIVDAKLAEIHPDYTQTSTYESRGFKRCFLYPRGAQ